MNMIDGLSQLLANTYVLYAQTQGVHWNITGAHFYAHHKMFEEQYTQLASAIDDIAERIRSLNAPAPGSLSEFLKLATLNEAHSMTSDRGMIQTLLHNHEALCTQLVKLFEVAQSEKDEVTLDLLIERKAQHDKIAWMLRSLLQ